MVGPVKVRDSNGQLKYYLYVVSTGLGGSLDGLDSGYSCFKREVNPNVTLCRPRYSPKRYQEWNLIRSYSD